ncbi:MAG: response regulator [Candidatus Latescibacterota bacterium]
MIERPRILIVDDDESICSSLKLILDRKGYETEWAGTGREALEKVQARFFNLVLLDIQLPDTEGVALLGPFREAHPDMVVIMVTGHASLESAMGALNEGASAYVTKPMDMEEVLADIEQLLEKQHLVTENRRLYQAVQEELAERKRAEETLRQNRDYLRALLNSIHDHVLVIDLDYRITEVNQSFLASSGYTREEAIGSHCYEVSHGLSAPCSGSEHPCPHREVLATGGTAHVTHAHADKKGDTYYVDIVASPLRDAAGQIVGVVEASRDVTTLKVAEETAKSQHHLLRTVIDNLPDRVFAKDPEGRFILASEAVLKIMKAKTEEEVIGKRDFDFFPKEKAEAHLAEEEEILRTGQPIISRERLMIQPSGEKTWTLVTKVPLRNSEGRIVGIAGMNRDITPLRQSEEEKGELQAQLLQSQKMEAIGTLAGGVAHDFNNLLTIIQGYTELTMRKTAEDEPLYLDLKRVYDASVRAAHLTRQLLLFSRRQPIEIASLDLGRTVEDLLKMLKRLIGEDIVVHTDLAADLWTVEGDVGNLEQVITNLVVNARDAMPEGGKLTIKTENVRVDKTSAKKTSQARAGNFVCLSIEDTGIGLDKETAKRIFEPFFTTKEFGRGTGLGLSVVYGIVTQHQGWIQLDSEPGLGSKFALYLPATSEKSAAETGGALPTEPHHQNGGQRILVVEDEKGVRDLATRAFSATGYVVFQAASAEEALEIFAREQGNFHLVFCDVILPGTDGPELVDQLVSRNPQLRALLTSGYAANKVDKEEIRKKGYRFLQKPYSLSDLLGTIRELLAGSSVSGI